MQTKLKQEFHEREFANWQNKGETLHLRNQLTLKLDEARAKAQSELLNRRYRVVDEGKSWRRCWKRKRISLEHK